VEIGDTAIHVTFRMPGEAHILPCFPKEKGGGGKKGEEGWRDIVGRHPKNWIPVLKYLPLVPYHLLSKKGKKKKEKRKKK